LRHFAAVAPHTAGMRRPGSAALDLVHVACGHFDAFWELTLKPWDFAAGMLLVREAGGVVTTVTGDDVPLTSTSLLAGNPVMHRWLARTLADATVASSTL
jgi:myo-inositol-1(or 4)-monophosphatase